ncbi:MAG: GerMN domain-containing protein [Candidatus Paceibacterota bacterium]
MTYIQDKNHGSTIGVIIFIIAILALGAFLLFSSDNPNGDAGDSTATISQSEFISVKTPGSGDQISSPLTVSGKARGQWYFEADFPVEVVDNAGNSLGMAPATADGEWMTEDFVPFSGQVNFDASAAETADGRVIFHRANPSGLEENADSIEVPVTFSDEEAATTTVKVFWSNDAAAVAGDCSVVGSFEREIPATQAVGQAALSQLLAGPTATEVSDGFSTNIPDGVSVNSLRIEDGVAYVDFSAELNQIGGSCRVTAIYNQIHKTLLQFSSVDEVEISVDGETEAILQP